MQDWPGVYELAEAERMASPSPAQRAPRTVSSPGMRASPPKLTTFAISDDDVRGWFGVPTNEK